jgi:phage terminase Nu1 subunit (DNA packaging protein)
MADGQGGNRPGSGRKSAATEDATAGAHILYTKSRAKRQAHLAKMAEMDERERKGELIPKTLHLSLADRSARIVRARMENIPSRLASALVGLDDKEIERILRDEIRAALNDASAEVKNDEDSEHEEISN